MHTDDQLFEAIASGHFFTCTGTLLCSRTFGFIPYLCSEEKLRKRQITSKVQQSMPPLSKWAERLDVNLNDCYFFLDSTDNAVSNSLCISAESMDLAYQFLSYVSQNKSVGKFMETAESRIIFGLYDLDQHHKNSCEAFNHLVSNRRIYVKSFHQFKPPQVGDRLAYLLYFNVNDHLENGSTILHMAAYHGNYTLLKFLFLNLPKFTHWKILDRTTPIHQITPLHLAITAGHCACVDFLLTYCWVHQPELVGNVLEYFYYALILLDKAIYGDFNQLPSRFNEHVNEHEPMLASRVSSSTNNTHNGSTEPMPASALASRGRGGNDEPASASRHRDIRHRRIHHPPTCRHRLQRVKWYLKAAGIIVTRTPFGSFQNVNGFRCVEWIKNNYTLFTNAPNDTNNIPMPINDIVSLMFDDEEDE